MSLTLARIARAALAAIERPVSRFVQRQELLRQLPPVTLKSLARELDPERAAQGGQVVKASNSWLALAETNDAGSVERSGGKTPPQGEFADLPIAVWFEWRLNTVRAALNAHAVGTFGQSALLAEGMLSDDRVQAAMNGRAKGVTKCEPLLTPADDPEGESVADEIAEVWDEILPEETLEQIMQWATFEGFCLLELVWEAWPSKGVWIPRLKVWHPLYVYYRIDIRRYVAIAVEGMITIEPDDPKWWIYTPFDGFHSYRGWIRGAVRSCAVPWLVRQFALRDWARFSEVHGLPMRVAKYPAQAPAIDKARFVAGIRNLGAETTVGLPIQTGPDAASWAVELIEAAGQNWQSFPGLRDACDQSITLAVRGTNLTTQVSPGAGSKAAADTHRDEDSDYARADRRKLCSGLRRHVLRWYCIFNRGNTDCLPKKVELVDPESEDRLAAATASNIRAQAVYNWKKAGVKIDAYKTAEECGEILLEGDEAEQASNGPLPALPAAPKPGGFGSPSNSGDAPPDDAPVDDAGA